MSRSDTSMVVAVVLLLALGLLTCGEPEPTTPGPAPEDADIQGDAGEEGADGTFCIRISSTPMASNCASLDDAERASICDNSIWGPGHDHCVWSVCLVSPECSGSGYVTGSHDCNDADFLICRCDCYMVSSEQ